MEVEVDDDGIRVCFKIDDEKGTPLLVAMNLVPDNAVLQGRTNTMLFSFTNNPIPMPMPPLLILNNLPQTLFCWLRARLLPAFATTCFLHRQIVLGLVLFRSALY